MDQIRLPEEEGPSWNLDMNVCLPGKVETGRQMGTTRANMWRREVQGTFKEQRAACCHWGTHSAGVRGRNWMMTLGVRGFGYGFIYSTNVY